MTTNMSDIHYLNFDASVPLAANTGGGHQLDRFILMDNITIAGASQDEEALNVSVKQEIFNSGCEYFNFIVSVLILGFSCLCGFVGNFLSIVILQRDPRKSVTLFLLTVLAVVDCLFLIPIMFLFTVPGVCRFTDGCTTEVMNILPYINKYGWAVASMLHTGTVYVTMLVTIHRYLSVCRPMDAPRLSTLPQAKKQVVFVALFAIIFSIPRYLEYQIIEVQYLSEDGGIRFTTKRHNTDFGNNIWYQIVYRNICFYLIMYIIPLSTLTILSWKLTQTLRERKQYRFRVTSKRNRKEDNTTLVLVIIVAIFIFCQTPLAFQRLFLSIFGDSGRVCGHFLFYFEIFSDYLAVLNSCVNFMVYVIFAKGFRQTLRTTLCGKKPFYNRTTTITKI